MDATVIKNENDDNFADAQERAKQVIARGDEVKKAINYSIYTSDMSFELKVLLMGLVSTYKHEGFGLVGLFAGHNVEDGEANYWELADREANLLLRLADDNKASKAETRQLLKEIDALSQG